MLSIKGSTVIDEKVVNKNLMSLLILRLSYKSFCFVTNIKLVMLKMAALR